MRTGRPKGGEKRESDLARLPAPFLEMVRVVAEERDVPIGDVIASAAGGNIERAYRRIMDRRQHELGEAGA